MGRPKSKGPYVPLAAQYYMDDAILEAGPEAELLFVRILSFLASVPSDGYITDRQLRTVVALGLRNVNRRVESLLRVGLLEAQSGGFAARSWQKWNRSTDEVGKLLAKDRARKAQKSAAEPADSERNPNGIQPDSEVQSRAVQSSTEQGMSEASASDDAQRLCDLLAELVRANGHRVGSIGKAWLDAADRLIRLDGYDVPQIEWVMRWATSNEFWAANIRSMPKLREKFSTLKLQGLAEHQRRRPSVVEHGREVDEILRAREVAGEQLALGGAA